MLTVIDVVNRMARLHCSVWEMPHDNGEGYACVIMLVLSNWPVVPLLQRIEEKRVQILQFSIRELVGELRSDKVQHCDCVSLMEVWGCMIIQSSQRTRLDACHPMR